MSATAVSRWAGITIFVLSFCFVVFAGLFPFDFANPRLTEWASIKQLFWIWNPNDPGHVDRIQNLLFLMPFGFGAAAVVRARRLRIFWQIFAAAIASLALSSCIEFLQSFVSFRDPSVADVWANTIGGTFAGMIYAAFGQWALQIVSELLLRLRRFATPLVIGILLIMFAAMHLAAPFTLHNAGDLRVWDADMPIVAGNELTGDRNFSGSISEIVFCDRAASANQIFQLSSGVRPEELFGDSLLVHYKPRGDGPFADLTSHEASLIWSKNPPDPFPDGVMLVPDHWLHSTAPVTKTISRIQQSGEFTIATLASSFNPDQFGYARIVGISRNPRSRNVQLCQQYADLAIRVRTAVSLMPEIYVRDIFATTAPHYLAVTERLGEIVVYVDGAEKGRMQITPEAKVIWRLYPRNEFRLRIENYGYRSYAIIYRLLVFVPFSLLLAGMIFSSDWQSRTRYVVAILSISVMAFALEIVLGTQTIGGFQFRNLLVSLAIGFAALGGIRRCRKIEFNEASD